MCVYICIYILVCIYIYICRCVSSTTACFQGPPDPPPPHSPVSRRGWRSRSSGTSRLPRADSLARLGVGLLLEVGYLCMCTYICIHMNILFCIYIYMISMHIYTYTYMHMSLYVDLDMDIDSHACMYIRYR